MEVYRLIYPKSKNDIMFGIENSINEKTIGKLNAGISELRPYKHLIPYYNNENFAFISLNAFKNFLFNICNINKEDLALLNEIGFYVKKEKINTYCKGYSNILCSYFDEEITDSENLSITDMFNDDKSFQYVYIDNINMPKELISLCKEKYYKNKKFIK